jgi:hypothetical protein
LQVRSKLSFRALRQVAQEERERRVAEIKSRDGGNAAGRSAAAAGSSKVGAAVTSSRLFFCPWSTPPPSAPNRRASKKRSGQSMARSSRRQGSKTTPAQILATSILRSPTSSCLATARPSGTSMGRSTALMSTAGGVSFKRTAVTATKSGDGTSTTNRPNPCDSSDENVQDKKRRGGGARKKRVQERREEKHANILRTADKLEVDAELQQLKVLSGQYGQTSDRVPTEEEVKSTYTRYSSADLRQGLRLPRSTACVRDPAHAIPRCCWSSSSSP